jgi:dolichyl-phosphate-mannose--protein O-mannosyl transferase
MIRPVWYFVDYSAGGKIGNIYALGNPLIWWNGLAALAVVVYKAVTDKAVSYKLMTIGYFIFWLPWLFSPRVMFLYHYLPSLTFLILSLAWFWSTLSERWIRVFFIVSVILAFLLFYPHWVGTAIPQSYHRFLLWLPSWQ